MSYYLTPSGAYYEGDRIDPNDREVPQRPLPDPLFGPYQFDRESLMWVVPLSQAQAAQTIAIKAACAAAITGGFTSSALGQPHTYPSKTTDQINLMGSVTDSLLPGLPSDWTTPFWCADDAGVWSYHDHTADQIQEVGKDGKAWVVACQTKCAALLQSMLSA